MRPLRSITSTKHSDFQLSALGASLSPESLRWALDQGAAGDLAAQNGLFDLMEDTWDRLRGNIERFKKAVCKLPFTVQPWSEKGQKPTPSAVEKARFVEHVLHNQRAPTWEGQFNFTGTVHALLDAVARGVAVLEVDWTITAASHDQSTPRDLMAAQQRKLAEVRAANPDADFSAIFTKAQADAPELFR